MVRYSTFARLTIADQSNTHKWIKKSPARLRKDSNTHSIPTTVEPFVPCKSPEHATLVIGGKPSIRRGETHNPDSTQYPRSMPHCLWDESDLAHCAPSSEVSALESEPQSTDYRGSNAESVDVLLTQWSEHIFHHGFGAIFGRWVGRNGCPFV